jgi:phosphatidylglycerophosphate synthase
MTQNQDYFATLKSAETEDWLDFHVIRPFCFHCAKFFAKFDVHPNTITIWSMIIGAASSFFFAQGCYHYEGVWGLACNLIAIFLLMWADIYDCTDGQLARMTGKKSRLGRILDGVAGFTWFFPIYTALVWRFYVHHDIEFGWFGIADTQQNVLIATGVVFVMALISGLWGLERQQRLADYYIQVHLFFLKGEKGSELDNSARQQEIYDQMPKTAPLVERLFQHSYIGYTKKQENVTPEFQNLMARLRGKYGSTDNIPEDVREEIHRNSLPLMKYNGLLTFNFRSFWLFLFCLLDVPVMNFVFETIAMSLLAWYVNHRHETFCRKIAESLR